MTRDDRKCVFFDFDGVIADTCAIALQAGQVVCPGLTAESNRIKFESNVNEWFKNTEYHSDSCRHDINWWSIYLPLFEKCHPFPGSIHAVQDLSEKYRLAIISSTISSPIVEFLKRYDAAHYFEDVFGNDIHASKVEKMNMLFARYELVAEQCVFVTDTLGDIRDAQKLGVGVIGVSWGFHERERLEKGNPFTVIERPHELPAAVDAFFVRPMARFEAIQ